MDNKIQKLACENNVQDTQNVLMEKVQVLNYHLHVKWEQHKTYNQMRNGLKENGVLAHVDFAEIYENKKTVRNSKRLFWTLALVSLLLVGILVASFQTESRSTTS